MASTQDLKKLPLIPECIVDFAWGLSSFLSDNEQEKKFGEDLQVKWDNLALKFKGDRDASRYLDNVYAAIAGTIESLAQLRQNVMNQFNFLDTLQKRRVTDLDDLANLSKDAQSIASRIVSLSVGGAGGASLTFLQYASNALGAREIVYAVGFAGVAYFMAELLLRVYRNWNAPRIYKQTQKQKETIRAEQFEPKVAKLLYDLLQEVKKIANEIYPDTKLENTELEKLSVSASKIYSSSFV